VFGFSTDMTYLTTSDSKVTESGPELSWSGLPLNGMNPVIWIVMGPLIVLMLLSLSL
jgi:hypothetical protein